MHQPSRENIDKCDSHTQARDAERYRAIRKYFVRASSYGDWFLNSYKLLGVSFEAALDAAIAREAKEEACRAPQVKDPS